MPKLIECKDCGNSVSKRAASCPNCGAPIGKRSVQKAGRRRSGGGCFTFLLIIVGLIWFVIDYFDSAPFTPAPLPDTKITAELSDFTTDRENAQFVFTLQASNGESNGATIYAVVYGQNGTISPPRRNAWPFAGLLFARTGSGRGRLSPLDISEDWNSRPDNTKGMKIVMQPNGSKSLEGALPINETSNHEAWLGEPINPRVMYNDVSLWIFTEHGRLILEKSYSIK